MITSGKLLRVALMGAACTALFTLAAGAAPHGAGTVTADALRMRATPTTDGEIVATAPAGTNVVVLEAADDNWYKVSYNTVEGYMSGQWLTVAQQTDVKLGYGKVKTEGSSLNLRTSSASDSAQLASLPNGTPLTLEGINAGWYKVTYDGKTGYVSGDYVELTAELEQAPAATDSSIGAQAVAYSKQFMGVPYVYGANGPKSFDCSGFTSYVYRAYGIGLNRSAAAQLQNGYSVSKDDLKPGDLVFFKNNTTKAASHVGLYIGEGNFIHASTNQYQVRIDSLYGYYAKIYVGARRVA